MSRISQGGALRARIDSPLSATNTPRALALAAILSTALGNAPAWAQGTRRESSETSVVLDPISVEGTFTATPTYRVEELYSGTKTVTPRRDVPQQGDVVPREVLLDTTATRVEREKAGEISQSSTCALTRTAASNLAATGLA